MKSMLLGLMILAVAASSGLANLAPFRQPPGVADVKTNLTAELEVIEGKAVSTEILIPKKFLAAADPISGFGQAQEGSSFWFEPAVFRTIVAGLLLSAAVVASLLLLRNRQTKLATASLVLAAVSLGVVGTSIADIAPPPPEIAKAKVVIKYVDGDTVTIIKGTGFPK